MAINASAESQPKTHYTYVGSEHGLGDIFYKNSAYYRCMTQIHCKLPPGPVEGTGEVAPTPKKLAIFLKNSENRQVIPSFLQCHAGGTGMVAMAEELIPVVNQAVARDDKCADVAPVEGVIPQRFVDDTLKALQGYDKKCKKEDRSCFTQITEGLENDLRNMFSLLSFRKNNETTKMGCLSTMVSNVVESLYSTLKLFLWDMPKGAIRFGKSLWSYVFNEEEETSTAMLYGSILPANLAEALADWDLAKFYDIVRKNFLNFLGAIREFYTELMGCAEWQGMPYQSECLKKTNWSCPTCESVMNFTCGLAGQLGTGFMLGGVLGTAKSIASLSQMKKAISLAPQKYGLSAGAIEEMGARMGIQKQLASASEQAALARYRLGKVASPLTNVLKTIGDEMKFVFGMGTAFKKFVAANPVTMPYHLTYQGGKNVSFKFMNNMALERGYFSKGSTALNLGRRYAMGFKNIQDKHQHIARDLSRIKGKRFNQTIYNEVVDDYLGLVKKEMELVGVKVTKLPDGKGLRLEKGGEAFDYSPNFKERMDKISTNANHDDFAKGLTYDDIFLDDRTLAHLPPQRPNFLQEMLDKASDSKELYTIKPDGMDGMVYLGHFAGQQNSVPRVNNCNELLHGAEPITVQEIQDDVAVEAKSEEIFVEPPLEEALEAGPAEEASNIE